MLNLGVRWMGLLPGWLPHHRRWIIVPQSGLTAWYVHQETRTINYPAKGSTLDIHALRKASTEASNLSRDEMSFNFSLSIYLGFYNHSSPRSRGKLWRRYVFIMSRPVRNYVPTIVL
jgi:hypothetical protein